MVSFAKRWINEELVYTQQLTGETLGDLFIPIVLIVFLANGGANLKTLTTALRDTVNQVNITILNTMNESIELEKTLAALSDYGSARSRYTVLRNQCNGITNNEEYTQCLEQVNVETQETLNRYRDAYGARAPVWVERLEAQAQKIVENPFLALAPGVANPINYSLAENAMLAIAETLMIACHGAFQQLIELSMLVTAMYGPIALGLLLMTDDFMSSSFMAWIIAFFSLGMVKLSLNIITGLVATATLAAGTEDTLVAAIIMGLFAPILAFGLSTGGGLAVFHGMTSAASALASKMLRS